MWLAFSVFALLLLRVQADYFKIERRLGKEEDGEIPGAAYFRLQKNTDKPLADRVITVKFGNYKKYEVQLQTLAVHDPIVTGITIFQQQTFPTDDCRRVDEDDLQVYWNERTASFGGMDITAPGLDFSGCHHSGIRVTPVGVGARGDETDFKSESGETDFKSESGEGYWKIERVYFESVRCMNDRKFKLIQINCPSANKENRPSAKKENRPSATKENRPSATNPPAKKENRPSATKENYPAKKEKIDGLQLLLWKVKIGPQDPPDVEVPSLGDEKGAKAIDPALQCLKIREAMAPGTEETKNLGESYYAYVRWIRKFRAITLGEALGGRALILPELLHPSCNIKYQELEPFLKEIATYDPPVGVAVGSREHFMWVGNILGIVHRIPRDCNNNPHNQNNNKQNYNYNFDELKRALPAITRVWTYYGAEGNAKRHRRPSKKQRLHGRRLRAHRSRE